MGAVSVLIVDVLARDEALRRGDHACEVGMAEVVAGVQHRDIDALAGVSAGPDLRGADLCRGLRELTGDLSVQPDLGDAAGERRGGVGRGRLCGGRRAQAGLVAVGTGEGVPEGGRLLVVLGQRGPVDAGERTDVRRLARK
jgi:hypothetical protein